MNSIEEKIYMYNHGYVKGETRSKEYEAQVKQKKALNAKLDLADGMFNEVTFPFTDSQKKHVKELIKTFKNFNELYTRASNEEIILAFIFFVKALQDKKNRINTPKGKKLIQKFIKKESKQKNFRNMFEIIYWKITLHYIQKTPILPTEPQNIDHNILYKG